MAITCPPGTFSIQTLLLYFRHSHSLLFVLLFIILSLTWRISISGGRSARGKLCVLVLEKFLVFYGHTVQIYFTGFDLSFCALFVLWLDQFLDIFVITLHTQRNNTTWQLHLWISNWPVFNTEMGCSISRPWHLHVRGHSLWAAVFLTVPVLSLIVPQPPGLLLTKWPIMAFCSIHQAYCHSIHQAYCPPLLVWFYKPLFKTLCLIGWRGETPLLPQSSCGP